MPDPVEEADTQEEVVEEETQRGYLADMERESLPHIVHVSQDRLFSADLLCTQASCQTATSADTDYLALSLYPVFWKGGQ